MQHLCLLITCVGIQILMNILIHKTNNRLSVKWQNFVLVPCDKYHHFIGGATQGPQSLHAIGSYVKASYVGC